MDKPFSMIPTLKLTDWIDPRQLPQLNRSTAHMTPHVKLTVTDRNGRKCVSTGSPWEPVVGYSRAVREGDFIFVTGTVGLEPDGRFGPTLKDQTRRALEIIVAAIEALGGKASDVVRTRIYVTDISRWREAAEVHSEYFESIRPATTMVQVAKLIDDKALVEIEADAVVRHAASRWDHRRVQRLTRFSPPKFSPLAATSTLTVDESPRAPAAWPESRRRPRRP